MNEQQLQEIRERWAGKGPWFSEYGEDQTNREEPPSWNGEMYITGKRETAQYDQSSYVATVGYNGSGESDAAAIAAAPTDIATLLQEVERLNRMVDRAIKKMSEFGCVTDSDPCPGNYIEVGCAECVRKYLESEVADK